MNIEVDKKDLKGLSADYLLRGWHTLSKHLKDIETSGQALALIDIEHKGLNRPAMHKRLVARLRHLVAIEAEQQVKEWLSETDSVDNEKECRTFGEDC